MLGKPFILEEFNVAYNGAPLVLFVFLVGGLLVPCCIWRTRAALCCPPTAALGKLPALHAVGCCHVPCCTCRAWHAEQHRNEMFQLVQRLFQADIAAHPEDSAAAGDQVACEPLEWVVV